MNQPPPIPEHSDAPPSVAPPTQPGVVPGYRSSWPNVIGTLLCIFGGLGLLQRFAGTVMMAIMPALPMPPELQQTGTFWVMGLLLSIVGLPISIVHLVAGIQTLRRKPSARKWVVIFVVYAVLLVIPSGIYQYLSFQQQMQQMQQSGQAAPPAMAGQGFSAIVMILTVVISLAWPGFLLFWYSRGAIRREVESWGAA